MRKDSRNKFLSLGFGTELIDKIAGVHQTASGLKNQNKKALLNLGFSEEEIALITSKINRKPIEEDVLQSILIKSGEVCCYCADGNSTRPYQIHHIVEYHQTQDNSEANLLLVCPNHHVLIHQLKLSRESQLFGKFSWENIRAIEKSYNAKGIPFPFGAFEQLNYESPSIITEIFSFNSPSPALCKQLAQNGIGTELKAILSRENKVIIAGESGSGKTTLAKGVAGLDTRLTAYSYAPGKDTQKSVSEVLYFLSLCEKPVILLVDNANTWLTTEQIEQILRATSAERQIILIHTRTLSPDDVTLEKHFVRAFVELNWNRLKPDTISNLLSHEPAVISYLETIGGSRDIGSGMHQRPFRVVLENYASTVKTVWQFLFLLSSGTEQFDDLQVKLYSDERMDLVVLYIAIHQISQVENGVSIDQISSLFSTHSALSGIAPPSQEWILNKLTALIKDRIIITVRGRYNTIHREFSIRMIELFHFKAQKDTEELLDWLFNDFTRIQEIVVLWSWLDNTTAREYLIKWYRRLNLNQWKELISESLKNGLITSSLLATRMHYIAITGYLPIKEGFKDKAPKIVEVIRGKNKHTLHYLRSLFSALERNVPEVIVKVLNTLSFEEMAELVRQSDPTEFESILWLFNTIQNVFPQWIVQFSSYLTDSDFDVVLDKIERGDIDSLAAIVQFQRRYIANIKRSRFKVYTKKFASLLKGNHLEEVDCRALVFKQMAFPELGFYPDDIKAILQSLNKSQLSRDFEYAPARYWGNLLDLSILTQHIDDDTITQIINGIRTEKLIKNVNLYASQYLYELRLLIYQLCYADLDKKKEFANALYSLVLTIMAGKKKDENDVLKAFCRLDETLGNEICLETDIKIEDGAEGTEESHKNLGLIDFVKKLDLAEKNGEDYDMWYTKFELPAD